MSRAPNQRPVLAADVYSDESFCYLTAVQPDQLIYAILNETDISDVHEALRSDVDAMEALREIPNFSDRAELIPLDNIQSMEWYEEYPTMLIVYDEEKTKRTVKLTVSLSMAAFRNSIVVALQQAAGVPFETSTAKESIWRFAKKPLVWGGIFAWVFLGLGITGLMDGRETVEAPIGGRRRAPKELVVGIYNTVGPVGMCVIGTGIVLYAIFSVMNNYRRAPYKLIAKAQRMP